MVAAGIRAKGLVVDLRREDDLRQKVLPRAKWVSGLLLQASREAGSKSKSLDAVRTRNAMAEYQNERRPAHHCIVPADPQCPANLPQATKDLRGRHGDERLI